MPNEIWNLKLRNIGCRDSSFLPISPPSSFPSHNLAFMATYSGILLIVSHCQRTANDGTRASNEESDKCCEAIMYAMTRTINVHELRD